MNRNLLILGAGIYGLIAKEIAESMGCFDKIAFADDFAHQTLNGIPVVGTTDDLSVLSEEYGYAIVAIGKASVRSSMIKKIENEPRLKMATLISPRAFVSDLATIGEGSIIEPMAVVSALCTLGKGCFVCAGAVVNHECKCGDAVQIDCNATVTGNSVVPSGIKIAAGTTFA